MSKAIELKGEFGGELELTSETPVVAEELQRSVLIEGKGDPVEDGATVEGQLSIFNASNGEALSSETAQLTKSEEQLQPWAYQMLNCSSVGDRVAVAAPVADILPEGAAAQAGLEEDGSIIMVLDILEPCENLTPRDEKFPEVDLGDGTSEPKITIPKCMEPPTELEVEVLVEGDGAVVAADQNIMTNYLGVKWNGAERFDGSWSETGVQFSTAEGALIDGFTQAMVGQKIGSTILVTIPPEMGYGGTPGHQLEKDTLTFVLQLVSVAE